MILRLSRFVIPTALAISVLSSASGCAERVSNTNASDGRPGARVAAYRPVPGPAPIDLTPEQYISHITFLAHDALGGRGTGSDGIDIAAGYIAGQFAAAGLNPGGADGTFFQPFQIDRGPKLGDDNRLDIEGVDASPKILTDYTPFGFSTEGDFSGNVSFVGYGITAPSSGRDDYAGIDVTNQVVLMLRRQPPDIDADDNTNHATFEHKAKLALEHGASAVMIVNQDPGEDGVDGLMRFRSRGDEYGLPVLHVKRGLADAMLSAGGLPSITELQTKIDASHDPVSASVKGVHISGTVGFEANELEARNVIGVLPGMGSRKDEYVVIGGHYDHLGDTGGRIHNGADDNASGTAGVIETCRALAKLSYRDRSVICMAFTGEEMGLLGSRHYVEKPTVDIESIVAMINMDMIGRVTPDDEANRLGIQGLGTGDTFHEIINRRTDELGIPFIPDESAKGPSDHDSFYRKGVPSIFFFTGVHEDYHQPGDDVEKINAEGAAQIVDLVYRIAVDLINGGEAPKYVEVDERAKIFRGTGSPGGPGRAGGVVMGIMPSRSDDSELAGWRVDRVLPDGGAAKAGMKDGDRILSIGGQTVNGFREYRQATREKKPGDVVAVVVKRGRDELTLEVTLRARGG